MLIPKWMLHNPRAVSNYRAIMTTTDRERVSGEADVPAKKVYEATSRIRNRIDELEQDMEILDEHHPELAAEVREAVCESE